MQTTISDGIISKHFDTLGDFFYVLKLDTFQENYNLLNNCFKNYYGNFRIGYSYKTNYIPRLCKEANNLGAYAEVVSGMELEIAKKIGVKGHNIISNGPIVDEEVILFCITNDAKINIDNSEQLKSIESLLLKYPEKKADIGIRLNFDLGDGNFSRFGLDPDSEEFMEAIKTIEKNDKINLVGLQIHISRSDRSTTSYLKRLHGIYKVFTQLKERHSIKYFDLGGGFFGPMDENMRSQNSGEYFDFMDYGTTIGKEMKIMFPDESMELIIEPGLALTVNVMDFYTKVCSIKSLHKKYIINVSGSFYNVKPSGHKKHLTVKLCNFSGTTKSVENAVITGFTCLEYDILHDSYSGTLPEVGDYFVFENVGAYSIVFIPPFIKLSPPIVHFEGDILIVDKNKEDVEIAFESYNF